MRCCRFCCFLPIDIIHSHVHSLHMHLSQHWASRVQMAEATDLVLICCKDVPVKASSTLLMNSSGNAGFKDAISTAKQTQSSAELAPVLVPEDDSEAWSMCVALLQNPATQTLTWVAVLGVLRLANKYKLKPVLEACADRVVLHALKALQPSLCVQERVKGKEPWQFNLKPDDEGNDAALSAKMDVSTCVDIALELMSIGLKVAYKAFLGAWVTNIIKQLEFVSKVEDPFLQKKMAQEFKMMIGKVVSSLFSKPACFEQQLLADLFMSLAHVAH